jgi:hypothetical protein
MSVKTALDYVGLRRTWTKIEGALLGFGWVRRGHEGGQGLSLDRA